MQMEWFLSYDKTEFSYFFFSKLNVGKLISLSFVSSMVIQRGMKALNVIIWGTVVVPAFISLFLVSISSFMFL